MAVVIMAHDMHHADGFGNAGPLVQLAAVSPDVGVVDQPFAIAFEMQVIDGIKPGQRGEQPSVGLGYFVAQQITVLGEQIIKPVQSVK